MKNAGYGSPKQELQCPRCHKVHIREGRYTDDYIDCSCGYRFYAFAYQGLHLYATEEDVQDPDKGSRIQRFVTGYQFDPALGGNCASREYTAVLRDGSPDRLMDVVLARLQEETYGTNILKTKHIMALCEFLDRGMDVVVKYKQDKDRVTMTEAPSKDLMRDWERKNIPRAGDNHYGPDELAEWQEEEMSTEEYFQMLADKKVS